MRKLDNLHLRNDNYNSSGRDGNRDSRWNIRSIFLIIMDFVYTLKKEIHTFFLEIEVFHRKSWWFCKRTIFVMVVVVLL